MNNRDAPWVMACGAFSFARREGGGVAGKAWGILYILERFVFPAIALSTPFYTPQLSGGDSFTFQRLYRPLYLPFALVIVQIITKHMV